MSLKFFLKAYARIAAITAAVALLCVLLFNGINSVRKQYWHEHSVTPVMRWLAAAPDPLNQYHWMTSMFGLQAGSAADFGLPRLRSSGYATGMWWHSQPIVDMAIMSQVQRAGSLVYTWSNPTGIWPGQFC